MATGHPATLREIAIITAFQADGIRHNRCVTADVACQEMLP